MGFLSSSSTFERYWISGEQPAQFGEEQLDTLQRLAIDPAAIPSAEEPNVGFLAGEHVLDLDFELHKNVIADALHFGVRIDTNQVPSAIRKAWLQLELAPLTADDPGSKPTKAQRQEAKEAVEARCVEEAASGRFRRMQQVPLLWDGREGVMYVGSTGGEASRLCVDLVEQAFELELDRITSGKLAAAFAEENERHQQLNDAGPSLFVPIDGPAEVYWWNGQSNNYDYLGNEFLLWLWWYLETQGDTIALADESEVTGMFARTLGLECPRGESGKDVLSSESPIHLPEAGLAIRSGKLPRRAGLTLVRHGQQYDFALQAETFAVSGAKIRTDEVGPRGRASRPERNARPAAHGVLRPPAGRRLGRRIESHPAVAAAGQAGQQAGRVAGCIRGRPNEPVTHDRQVLMDLPVVARAALSGPPPVRPRLLTPGCQRPSRAALKVS